MPSDLTNLLPPERVRQQRRNYAFQFATVALALGTFLVVVAAGLLVPMYVYLARAIDAREARLATLATTLKPADTSALNARLTLLSSETQVLVALRKASTASDAFRNVLAVAHPGIALMGFAYTGGGTRTLAVTGVAATRDALRNYQLELQTDPIVKTADLPVSTYAKQSDIPFTITLTLTP